MYENKIVGTGTEHPEQLLANPNNWRIHPKQQQTALEAVLEEVGWVQNIIVNQRTGHVVDGHMRAAVAISKNETEVPVVYVDLSDEEELKVLATLDPIGAMAATDKQQLDELLETVSLPEVLNDLMQTITDTDFDVEKAGDDSAFLTEKFEIVIECNDEQHQRKLLGTFEEMGLACRSLIS